MNISVFAGLSLDGFLARKNDDLDFLPDDGNPEYGTFIATVDAMLIGRRTFEKVLTFGSWPYGKMPVFVLSANALDISVAKDGVVEHLSGDPAEIVERLRGRGFTHLYVDGGVTVQRFLRAGLVTRLIVTHVPVLIGEGIPLFGPLPKDIQLLHVRTSGL